MGIRPPNPLSYAGQVAIPNINRPFPPNTTFNDFPVPTIWVDTDGQDAYILVSVALGVATWVRIGGVPTDIHSLTGDDGIEVIGDSNGNVNVLGSIVASATHAKPLFFQQTSTSTLTADIQVGSAAASSNINNAGLASFNNAHFSVDANGYVGLVGGQQAVDSFIPDSGTNPVVPNGAGAVTMTSASGMTIVGGTNTLSHYAYVPTKWVVDPTANVGTHTTITAALAAASAGDDIFIRAGNYVENPTLKAGVNLIAFNGDQETPNVTIRGKLTATFAGSCSISGIRLQTNADFLLVVSGSSATVVSLNNCYLDCSNNTGISHTSSSSSSAINVFNCNGDLGTTGIALFVSSSAGRMRFNYCRFTNSGASTTASSSSAATINIDFSQIFFPLSFSSTGVISADWTEIETTAINTTAITANGTGIAQYDQTQIASGSASAISIGAGKTVVLEHCDITSVNTNAIAGTGTVSLTDVSFASSFGIQGTLTIDSNIVRGGNFLTQLVVGPSPDAYYQTITDALTAASAGQTIFVKGGTYTENPTLKAGVNIVAFNGDEDTPNVTIVGTCTATFAGSCTISNIRLQTNSAPLLTVSGSNATKVTLDTCYLNITNNDGISYTSSSSSSSIDIFDCDGDLGTTGIKIFNQTSTGTLSFTLCNFTNSGGSTTASTISAGYVSMRFSDFYSPFTATGTGGIESYSSTYTPGGIVAWNISSNPIANGNGSIADQFSTGAAACVDVSTGITFRNSVLLCNGPTVVSGAGQTTYWATSVPGGGTFATSPNTGAAFLTGSLSFDAGTNYLSNYSVGTWTPGLSFGGGTTGITYTTQNGQYTRIGNTIIAGFKVVLSNKGSSTGAARITGLPVSSGSNANDFIQALGFSNLTLSANYTVALANVDTSTTTAAIVQSGSGQVIANVDDTGFANTTQIYGTITYTTA